VRIATSDADRGKIVGIVDRNRNSHVRRSERYRGITMNIYLKQWLKFMSAISLRQNLKLGGYLQGWKKSIGDRSDHRTVTAYKKSRMIGSTEEIMI
jgi:hypothetical protein